MILFLLNLILPIIAAAASFVKSAILERTIIVLSSIGLVINNILFFFVFEQQDTIFVFTEVLDGYEIAFKPESISIIFALMVSILYLMTNLYGFAFLKGQEHSSLGRDLNQRIHFFFTPIAIMATICIGYSANLLTLFVFYEVLTFSTYPLVIQSFSDHARRSGKFYLATLFGTSSFFIMFALIYLDKYYGSSDFNIGGIFDEQSSVKDALILLVCFVFGFSKTAIFPLYQWLPRAMVAPIPVSALLHAVAVVKSGIFALMKVFVYLFGMDYLSRLHEAIPWSIDWLTYLACFTMLYAGLIACLQNNLKKILAYSTISQLSYMILLLSFTSLSTFNVSFLQMLSHAVAKITLFFSVGVIYIITHKIHVDEIRGMVRTLPIPTILFILASFSIIGLPPSVGWVIKSLIFDSIVCDKFIGSFAKTCLLIGSFMSCYYLLRPAYQMLCPPENKIHAFCYHGRALSVITAITFSLSVLLFFYLDDIIKIISIDFK
ncbi:MAG: proton-conducting transporter membrane subunit [Rickettsiales bacterium]|jgi:multicomponent Na+:H+ antiporter subunit D|nr:proton-conducting transporter membrane subunit [Rickettsiales bacterium]